MPGTSLYNLGHRHNPTGEGTLGLLKEVMGIKRSMEMVHFDYYEGRLEAFTEALRQTKSDSLNDVFWVVGNRGTGKSQVLAHVFRELIIHADGNVPLPIFLSMSDPYQTKKFGVTKDSEIVPITLLDEAARESLKDTFSWLREEKPVKHYASLLGGKWFTEDGFAKLSEYLDSDNFQIVEFAKMVRGSPLDLVLICDDFDKFSPQAVRNFLRDGQDSLGEMTSAYGTPLILSVTKEFMEQSRTSPGLDWCIPSASGMRSANEVEVPDIGDLTSKDVQNFIDSRVGHVHKRGSSWWFDAEKKPRKATDVVREWGTYDPTKMRVNGSMLVLFSWMAKTQNRSLRQVLEWITAALNHRPTETELTSSILTEAFRQNNKEERKALRTEFLRRLKNSGVTSDRITKEYGMMQLLADEPHAWKALGIIAMDMISLGRAKGPGYSELNSSHKKIEGMLLGTFVSSLCEGFNTSSAVYNYLEMVRDISEREDFLEQVVSRRPEELFNEKDRRNIEKWLEDAVSLFDEEWEIPERGAELISESGKKADREEESKEERSQLNSVEEEPEMPLTIIGQALRDMHKEWGLPPHDSLEGEEYEALIMKASDEDQKEMGHGLGRFIVQRIHTVEEWQKDGHDYREFWEDEPRLFCNGLVMWFARQCREVKEEVDCANALKKALNGIEIWNLRDHEEEFQKVVNNTRKMIGVRERALDWALNGLGDIQNDYWEAQVLPRIAIGNPEGITTTIGKFCKYHQKKKKVIGAPPTAKGTITVRLNEKASIRSKSQGDATIQALIELIGIIDSHVRRECPWIQFNNITPLHNRFPSAKQSIHPRRRVPEAVTRELGTIGDLNNEDEISASIHGILESDVGTSDDQVMIRDLVLSSQDGYSWAELHINVQFESSKSKVTRLLYGLSVEDGYSDKLPIFAPPYLGGPKTSWPKVREGLEVLEVTMGKLRLAHPFSTTSEIQFSFSGVREETPKVPFNIDLAIIHRQVESDSEPEVEVD